MAESVAAHGSRGFGRASYLSKVAGCLFNPRCALSRRGGSVPVIAIQDNCRHCRMPAVLKNEISGAIDLLNHEVKVHSPRADRLAGASTCGPLAAVFAASSISLDTQPASSLSTESCLTIVAHSGDCGDVEFAASGCGWTATSVSCGSLTDMVVSDVSTGDASPTCGSVRCGAGGDGSRACVCGSGVRARDSATRRVSSSRGRRLGLSAWPTRRLVR